MSFKLLASLLLILFYSGETISCPTGYNAIVVGACYKINNGTGMTWSKARDTCKNDTNVLRSNETVPNATTHLAALEVATEKNSLFYWMNAYGLQGSFWIDGIVSTNLWDWSNQSITWYFDPDERAVIGNGSNYRLVYNSNQSIKYQIADDINQNELYFICEYQVPCNGTDGCLNGASCYMNLGEPLCVCAPGYTGDSCETEIDECLSSPCQHGGTCSNRVNNYTCDCSNIFYTGPNCEIPKADPTQKGRDAAFWSVAGVVCALIALLSLSDLPWEEIMTALGCSCPNFKCCSKEKDDENMNENDLRLSDSPANDQNLVRKQMSPNDGIPVSQGKGYQVMNTVWNPELVNNQTPRNPQYNGYRSPDQHKSPDNTLIQSFAAVTVAKQKQKEDKRVYAVDIDGSTKSASKTKDPADTMVSWTQQLQEQLRNKNTRETSASSTKQLIHSSNSNGD